MILWVKNNLRMISVVLIIMAIAGFFWSAVVINIEILNISEEFSLRNAFLFLIKRNWLSQVYLDSKHNCLR